MRSYLFLRGVFKACLLLLLLGKPLPPSLAALWEEVP